ncbi:MAG TPA: hypothetical protein VFE53_04395, partial [Mucilaginibacter sp.]|nr:hypothetical protein [Mucilaginibacter sp.]
MGYKIDRYADQYNYQTGPGKLWFVNNKQNAKGNAHYHVNRRQKGIAERFIGSLCIRTPLTENEDTKNGK